MRSRSSLRRPERARAHGRARGTTSWAAVGAVLALGAVLVPTSASADVLSCQRTVGKSVTKFVKARAKALQKCEDLKVRGLGGALVPPDADCHVDLKTST